MYTNKGTRFYAHILYAGPIQVGEGSPIHIEIQRSLQFFFLSWHDYVHHAESSHGTIHKCSLSTLILLIDTSVKDNLVRIASLQER